MIPLRKKLFLGNFVILVIAIFMFAIVITKGFNSLSNQFFTLNQEHSESLKKSIAKISAQNIEHIRESYDSTLQDDARALLAKDTETIRPMVEDNAFNLVRTFLAKNLKLNPDIVVATFFVDEGGQIKAWQHVSRAFPEGLPIPIVYNAKTLSWKTTLSRGKPLSVPDEDIAKLRLVKQPYFQLKEMQLIGHTGQKQKTTVLETVAPVFQEQDTTKVVSSRGSGHPMGFLRYVISRERVEREIENQIKAGQQTLDHLEKENQIAASKTRSIGNSTLIKVLWVVAIVSIVLATLSFLIIWIFGGHLTDPIKELTSLSERMAAGQYRQSITVRTNDEIGILARSFQNLSTAITSRDEDLARINKNLENMNAELELRVQERTRELREAQDAAMANAHAAGMAEIATDVLHNIGNVVNGVNVSIEVLSNAVHHSKIINLLEANELQRQHHHDLMDFITKTPQGKMLLEYYLVVGDEFSKEHKLVQSELDGLRKKLDLILGVIHNQQEYAKGGYYWEEVDLVALLTEIIEMQASSFSRNSIRLEKNLEPVPRVQIQKIKFTHVVLNILKNAKEAVDGNVGERVINTILRVSNDSVILEISDNGAGIAQEDMTKLFTQGFSTKKTGHGFGIHYCANAMREMNGTIKASSRGAGKGATFAISIPIERPPAGAQTSST